MNNNLSKDPGRHVMYSLRYTIAFATNGRRDYMSDEVFRVVSGCIRKIAESNEATVEDIWHEQDCLAFIISATPRFAFAKVVNAMKSASSRIVRKNFPDICGDGPLWDRSYLLLSSGGDAERTIAEYMRSVMGGRELEKP